MTADFLSAAAGVASGIRAVLLKDAALVGGVYDLDYTTATILTSDWLVSEAGGIPRHQFLLATTLSPDSDRSADPDDEEILLVRVDGRANLPRQADLTDLRGEVVRELLATMGAARGPADVVDVLTRDRMAESAWTATIMGTFFDNSATGRAFIDFGSDVDALYASARYLAYRPGPDALSFLASYPDLTAADLETGRAPARIRLGAVRFASTRRRARKAGEDSVPVFVRVEDFFAQKVGILGKTRLGKSNTLKILATETFIHSRREHTPIGQLIFDPSGEYLEVNVQDGTALREIGPEWVSLYRFGADGKDPQVRPLQLNFYADDQRDLARSLIAQHFKGKEATYLDSFVAADLDDPDDSEPKDGDWYARQAHASRGRLAYYATLAKADFRVPSRWAGLRVSLPKALADAFDADHPGLVSIEPRGWAQVSSGVGLLTLMDWLCRRIAADDQAAVDWGKGDAFRSIRDVYNAAAGRAGTGHLRRLRPFHNPASARLFVDDIYDDLADGKIVLVDLRAGDDTVVTTLSERVVHHLLERAQDRFGRNEPAVPMQLFLEEAHVLFARDKFNSPTRDPWVRLAKEASKYRIGFCYATQEPSSVDHLVKSNTACWIVTHLNNSKEMADLAAYEGFSAYGDQILRADDKGFARLKTMSGKYIVPVQVDRFDVGRIRAARAAAGLDPDPPSLSSPQLPAILADAATNAGIPDLAIPDGGLSDVADTGEAVTDGAAPPFGPPPERPAALDAPDGWDDPPDPDTPEGWEPPDGWTYDLEPGDLEPCDDDSWEDF